MAGTIRILPSVIVENGDFESRFTPGQLSFVQTGLGSHETVVKVGTAEEDMPIGDISTEGWLILQNLHATAIVTWGPKSGGSMVAMGTLEPGEIALFRMSSAATLRWASSVNNSEVLMQLYED
jgi:hypothetical protein